MITQSKLKEFLRYDPESGVFTWLYRTHNPPSIGWGSWNGRFAGKEAGCINSEGYRTLTINGERYSAHRLVWLYVYGEWPDQIDHANHQRDDNRITNLRNGTVRANNQNRTLRSDNSSGIVGVSFNKTRNKWHSYIYINGKSIHLGFFDGIEEAAEVRKNASIKHGFHPNHGRSVIGL